MGTKRESVVFVLDVGPRMHPYLATAARTAGDFMVQKMLHKQKDEVCLLLFGATGTCNRENDKSAMEEGGEGEYAHIEEAHDLGPPDGEYIRTLHTLIGGQGRSDFKEALAVAAAVLVDERAAGSKRRIVLLSNLCSRAQEDPDDALAGCLAEGLRLQEIALEVLHLDVPEYDERYEDDKTYNLNQLATICQELNHRERHFPSAPALLSAFQAHEVAARATSTGHLAIGTKLNIMVKVSGKTVKEKFPPAALEVANLEEAPEGADLGVALDPEWHYVDQEAHGEEEVPAAEVAQALRYGCNLVPVEPEQKADYRFPTDKGMQLVGFLPEASIPRHFYMADVKVLVGDKASEASCLALAALVAALVRQRQCAVIRWVHRDMSQPTLLLGTPVAASTAAAPHMLLNQLPFMEDMRDYRFPSFTKKAWAPSQEQLDAAAALVGSMHLGEGHLEQLQPEKTADPALHRLYYECGRRVVDPAAPLQEQDALEQEVFDPHLDRLPGASEALAASKNAFPMHQAAHASRLATVKIGQDSPREDYCRLVAEEGITQEALEALHSAIINMVFKGEGTSKFQLAVDLVDTLREDCVAHDEPQLFNQFMEQVEKKCKAEESKCEFWKWLCRREIKLINKEEAPASQLDPWQTEEWYTQHCM